MWKCLSAALAVLCLAAPIAISTPARAQVTEASVIQQCKDRTALPNTGWTYKVAFTHWSDVQWGVQNPFPGRNPGDIHVELMVSASANFSCTPDLNGTNPPNLPSFTIPVTPRGVAYLEDMQACANNAGGQSVMTVAFPGTACPWPYRSGFPDIAQFTGQGPYSQLFSRSVVSAACTAYYAADVPANLRSPVILWGNGTNVPTSNYESLFAYWASYGFIVLAASTPNAGTGDEMITCLNFLQLDITSASSTLYRRVNRHQVATAGHSQGGGGAIMAGQNSRIRATVPFMPYILPIGGVTRHDTVSHGQQKGPMLLISGQNDTTAVPATHQQPVFNTVNVPVFWATDKAGGHAVNTAMARAALPFLRWQLMQHDLGAAYFNGPNCTLCVDPAWTVQKKGIP